MSKGIAHIEGTKADRTKPRVVRLSTHTLFAAVVCMALLLLAGSPARGEPEYQVKAAFVYNFAKFVEWPDQCFADPTSPIVIGVLGSSAIAAELEKAVASRKINGRPIVVKPLANAAAARGVHLLFIGAGEDARLGDLRDAFGPGVLTVGETDSFFQHGGMIDFIPEGDKLSFEINISVARQAGLKISAQLQKLAKPVKKIP